MFYGKYTIKTDNRRRIRIPAVFRKQLNNEKFIIEKNLFMPCLDVLPFSVFDEKMNDFKNRINIFTKEGEELLTAVYASFLLVDTGKKEIYLPVDFYDHLKLENKNELELVGMGTWLRLMSLGKINQKINKTRFQNLLEEQKTGRL